LNEHKKIPWLTVPHGRSMEGDGTSAVGDTSTDRPSTATSSRARPIDPTYHAYHANPHATLRYRHQERPSSTSVPEFLASSPRFPIPPHPRKIRPHARTHPPSPRPTPAHTPLTPKVVIIYFTRRKHRGMWSTMSSKSEMRLSSGNNAPPSPP